MLFRSYTTIQGEFNYNTSEYEEFIVEDTLSLSFEIINSTTEIVQILRIGTLLTYGTIYDDYQVLKRTDADSTNSLTTIATENYFNDRVLYTYLDDRFILYYNFDRTYNNNEGVFRKYYKGYLIK